MTRARSLRLIVLGSFIWTLACIAPAPAPEQTPPPPPPPPVAATPLALEAQLALAPPDTDYLAIRDLQAIVDRGLPWPVVDPSAPVADEPDLSSRARVVAFFTALRKWVDGPEPPLARSGIDLRGGLLLAEGYQRPPLLLLAGTKPDLTATLLTTLPVPDSEYIACRGLASAPGMIACGTRDGAIDLHRPSAGAARRRELAAALPGVDLDAAMVLGHAPSLHTDFAATFGPQWQVVHFRSTAGVHFRGLARDFVPGPPTMLRFVEPGASYVWVRVDGPAIRTNPSLTGKGPPIDDLIAMWTGEMLFAGSADPATIQLRIGVEDAPRLARSFAATPSADEEPLPGFAHGKLVRALTSVKIGDQQVQALETRVAGVPEISVFAALFGLTPRGQWFVSHDSAAMVAGSSADDLARLPVRPDATAALAVLPPEAAADVAAGRAIFLVHIDANALHTPAMSAALTAAEPFILADDLAGVRETLRALAVVSRVVAWGTEIDGVVVVHVAATLLGNTREDEGRAALAALTAGDPAQAFTTLASAHPDSPLRPAYEQRAGTHGPAALARSLVAPGLVSALMIKKLAGL